MVLILLLFGPARLWDAEGQILDISGAHDLLTTYFTRPSLDAFVVTAGINRAFLAADVSERLDKLLGSLETHQHICGNGTMLTCGGSVIHSRMPHDETRKILQFLKARPLGAASIRFTPVYTADGWHTLYCIRLQTFVLSVLCHMEVPLTAISTSVNVFESALIQSRLDLPAEEAPVLLRLFVKRETLALLYNNAKTQTTIFPSLRPGTDAQHKEILEEFWSFYGDASIHLNSTGVTEYSAVRDVYRFYCRSEGLHKIYLLFANESLASEPSQIASEALRSLKLTMGGQ
ncbi:hypothetical protein HDV03_000342 [Kappamyces sp. JEL0829]|nr:hypothetical protein HDV03_000342 [Kappamyces sp. JEL0829]